MDRKTFLIGVLIVTGMFMTLLDTTIVDIVIPHMMSAFDAKTEDIQWVIIAYMIASAIAMPTVGWVGGKFGHRNTYLFGIGLFTLMSALCGIAPNFQTMLIGRVFQGLGEGLAVPMALALLYEIFPEDKKGLAMGMYAIGAAFGPSLGPTIGGYLTEHMDWRWVFYVNILPGILVIYFLTLHLENIKEENHNQNFDIAGFLLLTISLTSLLVALSKGNSWGWHSVRIVLLFYTAIVTAILFIYTELKVKHPLVNLKLFKYDFFTYSSISRVLFGMGLYASYFMLPLYLERLRGFSTIDAGEILFFPAFLTGVVSLITGILIDKKIIGLRTAIIGGIVVFIYGTHLQEKLDLVMGKTQIILHLLPWGIGMGIFFPALAQVALADFKGELLRQSSALQNVLRLVGGSVGTSLATYILTTKKDTHFINMVERVSSASPQITEYMAKAKGYLYFFRSTNLTMATEKAKAILGLLFTKYAYWLSFKDVFFFALVCGILSLIPAIFIKPKEEANESKG
ncbi:DHA2 family efflux MFS transporter permease subunit [Desulfurobacterium atlanticum]|uniref:MFS transporter, DHA2 family, multidrug resistance protein n=1 Tax=Desulfurobacterium atlanticum TaxID=240169 RepID=A0A238Y2M0_9BACT|nr:DHA2 family efflux MFS transporter permease subunit [Desulfurobacterium atlanticum]SNR64903.1 MFS transporter, DHA2 family, multidrug resistance protein [Desulfurobacterium atlanticum]